MDLTGKAAHALARRSSRRQFFKFLGAGSLGAGLWLTRTDVSLGAVSGCVGCGGGPCNPCFSPAGVCDEVTGGQYPCKTCQAGGGCPEGCNTGGEWFCCLTSGRRGAVSAARSATARPVATNPSCHCFTNLPIPCTPRLHSGDQSVRLPSRSRRPSDGPHERRRRSASPRRSSRRQFFKFLGAGSLGAGLWLTRTESRSVRSPAASAAAAAPATRASASGRSARTQASRARPARRAPAARRTARRPASGSAA